MTSLRGSHKQPSKRNIYISSISAWEVAILVSRGRLKLTMPANDWVAASEALPFFDFVPVSNSIALKSVQLPDSLHNDPADRIIIGFILGCCFGYEKRKNQELRACQDGMVGPKSADKGLRPAIR